jgi:hypothetical protein
MLLTLLSYTTMSISKLILPVVAGVMSGMILQVLGERGVHALFPVPVSFGMSGKESLSLFFSQVSTSFYLLMMLNICLVTFVAGTVATFVYAKTSAIPAITVGIIISLGEMYSLAKIEGNPVIFSILCVVLHLPMAWLGYYIANKYYPKYLTTESK